MAWISTGILPSTPDVNIIDDALESSGPSDHSRFTNDSPLETMRKMGMLDKLKKNVSHIPPPNILSSPKIINTLSGISSPGLDSKATTNSFKGNDFDLKRAYQLTNEFKNRPYQSSASPFHQTEFQKSIDETPINLNDISIDKVNQSTMEDNITTQNETQAFLEQKLLGIQKDQIIQSLNLKIKDLNEKLEVLKAKRLEDRNKMKEIEKLKIQLQQLIEYKMKMLDIHNKLKEELRTVKTELDETKEKYVNYENEVLELNEIIEMATLDKEMAEEKIEGLQTQIEGLKEELEDKTLKYDLLLEDSKKQVIDLGGENEVLAGTPHVTLHQFKQLEQQNSRLKEAIIKLRDMASQEKSEKVRLSKENEDLRKNESVLMREREKLTSKLKESELNTYELREQVDAAMGSEEMVEALTNKCLDIEQKNMDLQEMLEDLEKLQEVNEEIQDNFKETEQDLIRERDEALTRLSSSKIKLEAALDVVKDHESTIIKFRCLVAGLQQSNRTLAERPAPSVPIDLLTEITPDTVFKSSLIAHSAFEILAHVWKRLSVILICAQDHSDASIILPSLVIVSGWYIHAASPALTLLTLHSIRSAPTPRLFIIESSERVESLSDFSLRCILYAALDQIAFQCRCIVEASNRVDGSPKMLAMTTEQRDTRSLYLYTRLSMVLLNSNNAGANCVDGLCSDRGLEHLLTETQVYLLARILAQHSIDGIETSHTGEESSLLTSPCENEISLNPGHLLNNQTILRATISSLKTFTDQTLLVNMKTTVDKIPFESHDLSVNKAMDNVIIDLLDYMEAMASRCNYSIMMMTGELTPSSETKESTILKLCQSIKKFKANRFIYFGRQPKSSHDEHMLYSEYIRKLDLKGLTDCFHTFEVSSDLLADHASETKVKVLPETLHIRSVIDRDLNAFKGALSRGENDKILVTFSALMASATKFVEHETEVILSDIGSATSPAYQFEAALGEYVESNSDKDIDYLFSHFFQNFCVEPMNAPLTSTIKTALDMVPASNRLNLDNDRDGSVCSPEGPASVYTVNDENEQQHLFEYRVRLKRKTEQCEEMQVRLELAENRIRVATGELEAVRSHYEDRIRHETSRAADKEAELAHVLRSPRSFHSSGTSRAVSGVAKTKPRPFPGFPIDATMVQNEDDKLVLLSLDASSPKPKAYQDICVGEIAFKPSNVPLRRSLALLYEAKLKILSRYASNLSRYRDPNSHEFSFVHDHEHIRKQRISVKKRTSVNDALRHDFLDALASPKVFDLTIDSGLSHTRQLTDMSRLKKISNELEDQKENSHIQSEPSISYSGSLFECYNGVKRIIEKTENHDTQPHSFSKLLLAKIVFRSTVQKISNPTNRLLLNPQIFKDIYALYNHKKP
ncbi:uncharacterized protein LOC135931058 isoform X2 [Gordionus sp. m RMFG-2023]|uniref:uncharacterized protein LOC135931058 isoform X2 n=1 Tax=Gordionus sp. m RMFG-2023 TaxID=3053472 RepID=UPI0031FD6E0E